MLFAPFLAGGCAVYARFVEPYWFDLSYTRIPLGLPKPIRLLHISDLHVSDGVAPAQLTKAVAMGLATLPDVICLTGDFVTSTIGYDAEALRHMIRMAAGTAPTFAVMGNHDGGHWMKSWGGDDSSRRMQDLVAGCGARVLHNRSEGWSGLRFVGTGDLMAKECRPAEAFAGVSGVEPVVVLCHNPDGKDSLTAYRWQLMLSGHTHGGQVRVGPGLAPWLPVMDKRFVAGLYQWKGRQLFISRGAGSPKHVRFGCRPEIAVLELT